MKGYEFDISKLAENSIIMKGQINDVVFGLKEISDKIDTLIALKQVELSLLFALLFLQPLMVFPLRFGFHAVLRI
mgnify:CR=1 FL=1